VLVAPGLCMGWMERGDAVATHGMLVSLSV
jgi:hypothetical protein